jgi:hypothetical protein
MAAAPTGRRDEAAVRRFIEHIAMTFDGLGFPRMAGRVLFVIMCAEEEALTAAQIAERLGVSPAAVSGGAGPPPATATGWPAMPGTRSVS